MENIGDFNPAQKQADIAVAELGIGGKPPVRRGGVILHPSVQHVEISGVHKHVNLLRCGADPVNQLPDPVQEPFRIFGDHLAGPFSCQLAHRLIDRLAQGCAVQSLRAGQSRNRGMKFSHDSLFFLFFFSLQSQFFCGRFCGSGRVKTCFKPALIALFLCRLPQCFIFYFTLAARFFFSLLRAGLCLIRCIIWQMI